MHSRGKIYLGDNLPILRKMESESVPLIYIDPPFNTGKIQKRARTKMQTTGQNGSQFGGRQYQSTTISESAYSDSFADYPAFLRPRLEEAHRILTPNGSLFFHIDWRESARCRLMLEDIFGGPQHCINEIIWAYDFGGRSKSRWPTKHDNIYWFAKNPKDYIFNYESIERIPYLAPGLVTAEKAARGKTPTDTWWHTIVPTNSGEKVGYATQKPLGIIRRIVLASSNVGDVVMDFFAGSGTLGVAAMELGRRYILIDENPQAVAIMKKRLAEFGGEQIKAAA